MTRLTRGIAITLMGLSLGFAVIFYTRADCHPSCSTDVQLEEENAMLREQIRELDRASTRSSTAEREAEIDGVIDYRRAKRAAARELLEQLEERDPT